MIKVSILFLALLTTTLFSRENPFFPSSGNLDIPITSNQETNIPPLKRATITLPSTARVIEGVTIHYKTLDGAQHEKSIELENSIDWHLPLFVSQAYITEQSTPAKKTKKLTVSSKKKKFRKILSLNFISFYEKGNELKIVTKDKMLRDFLLVKPHRIVCDFKRDTDIRSFSKNAPKNSRFTKVRIGTHKGYYRAVIELDGYYAYSIRKIKNGCIVRLR